MVALRRIRLLPAKIVAELELWRKLLYVTTMLA